MAHKSIGGWQLINGIWTQIWPQRRYNLGSEAYERYELRYPEPRVTLALLTNMERECMREDKTRAFIFMRYY